MELMLCPMEEVADADEGTSGEVVVEGCNPVSLIIGIMGG